jgi:flagellar biosynthesis/type III secretory pathway M-ring protein FliF/YscJ
MNNDVTNIPNEGEGPIDDKKLMDYLNEQLSKQESHDLEALMADDPFVSDAVEGLAEFSDKKSLDVYVDQLNRDLQKQLEKKKKRREKRKLPNQQWTFVAIVVLLLICIIAYFVIKRQRTDTPSTPNTTQQQKDKSAL